MSGRATPNGARRQSLVPGGAQGDTSSAVKVVVRIRPSHTDAAIPQRFQRIVVEPVGANSLQAENTGPSTASTLNAAAGGAGGAGKYGKATFTFDMVIGPDGGQPQVYSAAEPLISSFLEGFNATILAYGQTSSGKSYTMGTDRLGEDEEMDPNRLGITPRAVAEIFDKLEQKRELSPGFTYTAKVSYIEIYNEELLDLLAGEAGARPTVQIREDKSGHIVWQGLKEVKVSNAHEVMNLLAEGSTLRQTNSTAANAQSSRSHAIFSLTITQRKWAGPGAPPPTGPSSPQSPRVTNRLSQLPRNPAAGRSSTPTADRPNSRTGLRPPPQLGRPMSPSSHDDGFGSNGVEAWTSVVSKFHFVDLAGSERLKRTAAVGARATEAISINGGLSALGNVISALGDPSKKATHIPYRDSKLTRLLQDSLGGNARTLMVACISPTEWNLHETRSTLTYANRAKNIRNKAEINETEAGWDDLDYLHKTILKLRAELASIRNGDAPTMAAIAEESARRSIDGLANGSSGGAVEAELQRQVAQLTADLAKAQSSGPLSSSQFASAVEPIVEEYERSLSALESQLSLTRAALGHSEEEMRELEARVEEEVRTNETNSQLVDELRLRIAKLSEREATTEAYVRDLELKLKDVDEAGDAHGLAVSDLRKEIQRNREQAETTEGYIKDLEARLAAADESNAALKLRIEVLERDLVRREEAHKEVEARVALLDTTNESKLLLAEIDEKDRRVLELERALDDLKSKADKAEGESLRLQKIAEEEKTAKEELESTVRTLERAAVVRRSLPVPGAPDPPPQTPDDSASKEPSLNGGDETPKNDEAISALQAQVDSLQASHAAALADLEASQGKYQASLKEIEDLNSQVQEAKLLRSQRSFSSLSDAAASPASTTFPSHTHARNGDELDEELDEVEELASPTSTSHSRSGSPLSTRTTPRTPHARRSMPLSPGSRLSFLGSRGQAASSSPQQHLRSASLHQELSSAALSQISSPTSTRPTSPSPGSRDRRESLYGSTGPGAGGAATSPGERSYEQVKEEVLKLQTALNEREAEISTLESTIQQLRTPSLSSSIPGSAADSPLVSVRVERPSTPPNPDSDLEDLALSPHTLAAFSSIKAGLNGTGLGFVNAPALPDSSSRSASPSPSNANGDEAAEHAARLDDLMRSMAQKESAHREAVEAYEDQLATLQRQHDELTVLSRDQVVNMSSEIEQLRVELEGRPERGVVEERVRAVEEELERKGRELEEERKRAEESVEAAKKELVEEHQRLVKSLEDRLSAAEEAAAQHRAALSDLEASLSSTREELASTASSRDDHQRDVTSHYATIASLQASLAALTDSSSAESSRAETLTRTIADLEAVKAAQDDELGTLKEQLDAEREKHSTVSCERDEAVEKHSSLSEQHTSLCDQHSSLADKHSSLQSSFDALQASHDEVQCTLIPSLTSERDQARTDFAAALARIETASQDHQASSRDTEELRTASETLKADHAALLEHAKALEEQLEAAKKQAEEAATAAEHHLADLTRLRVAHGDLSTSSSEAEERLKAVGDERDEKEQARLAAATELAELRSAHEQLQSTHEVIASTVGAAEQRVKELEQQLDAKGEVEAKTAAELAELQSKHGELSSSHDELRTAHNNLRSTFDDLQPRHDELSSTLGQLRSQHAGLSSSHDQLQSEHQTLRSTHDELTSASSSSSDRVTQLEREVQEKDVSAASLAVEVDRLRQEQHASSAASKVAGRRVAELQASLEAKEAAAAAAAAEAERAVVELAAAHGEQLEKLRTSLSGEHEQVVEKLKEEHANAVEEAKAHHATALDNLRSTLTSEHSSLTGTLRQKHDDSLAKLVDEQSSALSRLRDEHAATLEQKEQEHAAALATAAASSASTDSTSALEAERDEAKAAHARLLAEVESLRSDLETHKVALSASSAQHEAASQRASDLARQYESASAEIATLRLSVKQSQGGGSPSTSGELQEALDALNTLEKALQDSQDERERLLSELHEVKGVAANGRGKYDSMFKDLESYRASITKLDVELVKARKERDSLSAQLARQSLSSSNNAGLGIMAQAQSPTGDSTPTGFHHRSMSPDLDRATSPISRSDPRFFSNGSTFSMNGKPPPPTPPPSVPPPPAPLPNAPLPPVPTSSPLRTTRSSSTSSAGGHGRASISGDTPATSVRSDSQSIDPRILERFKEQEAQLSRITKQLAQKEADLQAQVDLANTLDQALNDSERNLRKARLQSNEYARERDQYKNDNERLRLEAQDSHTTSESYRQSVLDLETRLQHERDVQMRAERTRQELDSRMAEVNRRKSKFNCF
ncbi:hypothetical protein JCM8547_004426 [Rhodosporidiobolus lusitaniae]